MTGRRSHGRLSALNGVVHQGMVLPVSSRHTRGATSQVGAAAGHATRAAATSGRSCSDGRTVFLTVKPRARTARQTVGTLAGVARASFRAHTCFEEIQFVPKNGDRRSTDFSSSRR